MAIIITKGIQLFFISPSGERLGILSDSNDSGSLLQFKIKTVKNGGVLDFSFNIDRENEIPISRNTEIYIYVDGSLWFNGFIDDIPEPDQDDPVLTIKGKGFFKRLEKKIINRTYTSQTLDYIAKDILSNELGFDVGVYYDVAKIDLPAITGVTIEFKNKTILKALDDILQIANYDYENDRYRYFVDTDKDFNIVSYGDSITRGLFEGFQYQKPKVKIENTKIRNKILTYRTNVTNDQDVEYVSTVEDTESQNKYGIEESKLVVPSNVDSTTLAKMASFIIERNKSPQKKISINDLVVDEILPFELYALNNRRLKYWQIINDCDSLTGWNVSNLTTATASLSSTHILSGRQSIKVECNGSANEYLEYTLSDKVPLPQVVRAFVYFDATPLQIQIEFFDITGNSTTIVLGISTGSFVVNTDVSTESNLFGDSFGDEITFELDNTSTVTVDQWLILSEMIGDTTNVETLQVNVTAGVDTDLIMNISETEEVSTEVRTDSQANLFEIKRVRVTILSDATGTFYIDRLDCQADLFKRANLLLESAEYHLSKTQRMVNADFGEKEDNIIDEIKDQVKNGDTAISIFAKQ